MLSTLSAVLNLNSPVDIGAWLSRAASSTNSVERKDMTSSFVSLFWNNVPLKPVGVFIRWSSTFQCFSNSVAWISVNLLAWPLPAFRASISCCPEPLRRGCQWISDERLCCHLQIGELEEFCNSRCCHLYTRLLYLSGFKTFSTKSSV